MLSQRRWRRPYATPRRRRWRRRIYVYIYVCVYIYIYMYVYLSLSIYIYIDLSLYMYIYIYVLDTFNISLSTYIYIYIYYMYGQLLLLLLLLMSLLLLLLFLFSLFLSLSLMCTYIYIYIDMIYTHICRFVGVAGAVAAQQRCIQGFTGEQACGEQYNVCAPRVTSADASFLNRDFCLYLQEFASTQVIVITQESHIYRSSRPSHHQPQQKHNCSKMAWQQQQQQQQQQHGIAAWPSSTDQTSHANHAERAPIWKIGRRVERLLSHRCSQRPLGCCIYIYIYINRGRERERERDRQIDMRPRAPRCSWTNSFNINDNATSNDTYDITYDNIPLTKTTTTDLYNV